MSIRNKKVQRECNPGPYFSHLEPLSAILTYITRHFINDLESMDGRVWSLRKEADHRLIGLKEQNKQKIAISARENQENSDWINCASSLVDDGEQILDQIETLQSIIRTRLSQHYGHCAACNHVIKTVQELNQHQKVKLLK